MRDEENGLLPAPQTVDHLRHERFAHGVEGSRGLVQDQDLRVQDHGHGKQDPLNLAAARLVGIAANELRRKPQPQQLTLPQASGFPLPHPSTLDQGLGDLVHDAIHRIQAVGSILEHHGHLGPAQGVERWLVKPDQLPVVQSNAPFDYAIGREQAHHGAPQGCLSGTGFTHHPHDPPRTQPQTHIVQGQQPMVPLPEDHPQVIDIHHHQHSLSLGSKTFSRLTARKVNAIIIRVRHWMGGRSQFHHTSR